MKQPKRNENNLIQYGVDTDLAAKAAENSLSLTKIRSLSITDIATKFGMTSDEAGILKECVSREPIKENIIDCLLQRSNFLCNICKGDKGRSYIIHHVDHYQETQDNSYNNLIVLCPTDHDLAHRSGLTLSINKRQLRAAKIAWEKQVEHSNAKKASKSINIDESAIDYVNVVRIEEACRSIFHEIPRTWLSARLIQKGILDIHGAFDYQFVKNNLSGGNYLFDYVNSGETHHYKELMNRLSGAIDFFDIEDFMSARALKSRGLEGQFSYFTGGVSVSVPPMPLGVNTAAILMTYRRRNIRIEWTLDPNYFMSSSAIARMRGTVRYTVYCHVRSITKDESGWLIKASPLLIAPPNVWVDRTPLISYIKRRAQYFSEDGDESQDFDFDGADTDEF
jgi:hypothetical protein